MATDFDPDTYGDVHRAFLQKILTKGIFGSEDTYEALEGAFRSFKVNVDTKDKQLMKGYVLPLILKINRELRPLGMEITRYMNERTGKTYYVLVNRIASAQTMVAFKDYTPNEMEYFKAVVAAIFDDDDRVVNFTTALNLTRDLKKKIRMEDAQQLLERWVTKKWLEKSHDGRYLRLHVRAVCELESYLKEQFNLSDCHICKNIITVDKNSECAMCETKAHPVCIMKLRRLCPNENCRAPWPLDNDEQSQASSASSQETPASHRRTQPMSDESGSDDESQEGTQTKKKSRA